MDYKFSLKLPHHLFAISISELRWCAWNVLCILATTLSKLIIAVYFIANRNVTRALRSSQREQVGGEMINYHLFFNLLTDVSLLAFYKCLHGYGHALLIWIWTIEFIRIFFTLCSVIGTSMCSLLLMRLVITIGAGRAI